MGQVALGIERDRLGGGDERAVGVVVGQLRLAQQIETVEVMRILAEENPQLPDRLGIAFGGAQGGGVFECAASFHAQ